jgi:hypothetical protein
MIKGNNSLIVTFGASILPFMAKDKRSEQEFFIGVHRIFVITKMLLTDFIVANLRLPTIVHAK